MHVHEYQYVIHPCIIVYNLYFILHVFQNALGTVFFEFFCKMHLQKWFLSVCQEQCFFCVFFQNALATRFVGGERSLFLPFETCMWVQVRKEKFLFLLYAENMLSVYMCVSVCMHACDSRNLQ